MSNTHKPHTSTLLVVLSVLTVAALVSATQAFAAAPETPLSEKATAITATTVTLNGVLNPLVEAPTPGYYFTYAANGTCEEAATEAVAEVPGVKVKALKVSSAGLVTPVAGLQPNKNYMFCVTATHVEGEETQTARSTPTAFKTLGAKPSIDSETASAVTPATATLEAQVNPNNQSTTGLLQYSTSPAVNGSGSLVGATKTAAGGLGEGYGDQPVPSDMLTGLAAGTTYYYQAAATNATGTTYGAVEEVTTVPFPHTYPVEPATITATTATFKGSLTPLNPVDTQYSFDYKLAAHGAECAGENATAVLDAGTSLAPETVTVSTSASGLQPNATYLLCLVASNISGSETAPAVAFTTLGAPPAVDGESSSITSAGVVVESLINANNEETSYRFEYSREGVEGPGGTLKGAITTLEGAKPLAGYGDQAAAVTPGAVLAASTSYYFRVRAENAQSAAEGKPVFGEVVRFTTPPAPQPTTNAAQDITRTTATLSGTVNPGGAETSYYFAYTTQAAYEEALAGGPQEKANPYTQGETTIAVNAGAGTEPVVVPATPISGLQPGQSYHYALIATSPFGTQLSADQTLTTPAGTPPAVTTGAASNITQNAATLTGTVNTNTLQTSYGFELASTPGDYGPPTGLGSLGGATTEPVAVTLTELQPNTTYYYRLTATNSDGTSQSTPAAFTTPAFPTLLTTPVSPALIATPDVAFPTDTNDTATAPKTLTKAQKLKKALKACKKQHAKRKQTKCEKQARGKYASAKKSSS